VWWFVKEQNPVKPESWGLRKRTQRSSKWRTWVLEKREKRVEVDGDEQEEHLLDLMSSSQKKCLEAVPDHLD
jgi:hypothetical protein